MSKIEFQIKTQKELEVSLTHNQGPQGPRGPKGDRGEDGKAPSQEVVEGITKGHIDDLLKKGKLSNMTIEDNSITTKKYKDDSVAPNKLEKSLRDSIVDYSIVKPKFEIGGINSNGPINNGQRDRCRTVDFIKVEKDSKVTSDVFINVYIYEDNLSQKIKQLISRVTEYTFTEEAYVKLLFSGTDLSVAEKIQISHIKQLGVKDNSVTIKKLATDTSNLIDSKLPIVDFDKYKTYIDNLFLMNGLNVDEIDIPDIYNTGVKNEEELVLKNELKEDLNGVTLTTSGSGVGAYYALSWYSNNYLEGTYVIENIKITKRLKLQDWSKHEKDVVLVFNNCMFDSFESAIFTTERIKVIFNNCTFTGTVSNSNITLNNCRLSPTVARDNAQPLAEAYFNNCLLDYTDYEHTEVGPHIDSCQIYGNPKQEAINVFFKNCNFRLIPIPLEGPERGYNACLMVQLEFNNGRHIHFEDCKINGGGFTVYCQVKPGRGSFELEDIVFKNVKAGCSHRWGDYFYPRHNENATVWDVSEEDELYIGSCYRDEKGINISVSNNTNKERTLKVVTSEGEHEFTIKKCLRWSEMVAGVTTFKDFPFDILKTINDSSMWIKCYDITDGEEKLIKTKVFM